MRLACLFLLTALAACQSADPPPVPPPSSVPVAAPDAVVPPEGAPQDTLTRPTASSDSVVVVFFGDSLTAGYGLANPSTQAYPALVGERLRGSGAFVRVVNAGNSGETSAGGLRRADWTVRRFRPDVFVLALGSNDGLRGQDPEAMEQNLAGIFDRVRVANPEARLVLLGAEALPNYGPEYTSAFRAVFPRLADRYDAVFVPFLLEGVAGVRTLNQPDGIHPTAEGHRLMADLVAPALVPIVRAAAVAG